MNKRTNKNGFVLFCFGDFMFQKRPTMATFLSSPDKRSTAIAIALLNAVINSPRCYWRYKVDLVGWQ